uniref:Uncharacterized protein n=1 Tax=Arundo donax TaxID=35708 RepID=A0A0A9GSV3_ARUDO
MIRLLLAFSVLLTIEFSASSGNS